MMTWLKCTTPHRHRRVLLVISGRVVVDAGHEKLNFIASGDQRVTAVYRSVRSAYILGHMWFDFNSLVALL